MKAFAKVLCLGFAAIGTLSMTTSALARTKVHEYYVIHDSETKTCTIVDKRPATHHATNSMARPTTVIGLGVYHTRAEAEAGMKQMDVCDKEDAHNIRDGKSQGTPSLGLSA